MDNLHAARVKEAVEALDRIARIAGEGSARVADDLVRRATQTGARICVVEDSSPLAPHDGAAALLRFRTR